MAVWGVEETGGWREKFQTDVWKLIYAFQNFSNCTTYVQFNEWQFSNKICLNVKMCLHCKRESLRDHFRIKEIKRSSKSVLDLELNLELKENKRSNSGIPSL